MHMNDTGSDGIDDDTCVCPPGTYINMNATYPNTGLCLACPSGRYSSEKNVQFWDVSSLPCQACPSDQPYTDEPSYHKTSISVCKEDPRVALLQAQQERLEADEEQARNTIVST